jgi:putative amide transporter protein
MLGVVLLYVGAVLVINGLWLIGQSRAAAAGDGGAVEAERHPLFMQGREVTVINLFTGFVGVVAAVTFMVHGDTQGDLADIRGGGLILLFAFTYLWVAANGFLNAGAHAFGWYCLFVAVTAVPVGIYTFNNANGNDASIYLGICWIAWAVLWFLFFVLLALDRPIARITGIVTVLVGIGTAWVLGFLVLIEKLSF